MVVVVADAAVAVAVAAEIGHLTLNNSVGSSGRSSHDKYFCMFLVDSTTTTTTHHDYFVIEYDKISTTQQYDGE